MMPLKFLKNKIKTQIMNGELKAGEALPSIRSLAKSLQISVLTVQKAYDLTWYSK